MLRTLRRRKHKNAFAVIEGARRTTKQIATPVTKGENMKITERKPVQKAEDLLTTVARSIGSTLGAVAAKVNATTKPSRRRRSGRTRARKHVSVSPSNRRASASISKRSNKVARLVKKNRKKSAK
jgi:hypothetical protein